MRIQIREEKLSEFIYRAKEMGDWLHYFNFQDSLFTGYYKYQGLGASNTIAAIGDTNFDALRRAYADIDHTQLSNLVSRAVAISGTFPTTSKVLELGASSGQLALQLADLGFKKVEASEIRTICCDQINLIKECAEQPTYKNQISVRNDRISIDSPDFVNEFNGQKFDIVFCSRTLNHLANPIQAIKNMANLSRSAVFIYCQTMINPLPSRLWSTSIDSHVDLTSSIESANITPHYRWIPENTKALGFARCEIFQPEIFDKFTAPIAKKFDLRTRVRLAIERSIWACTKIRLGHVRAFDKALMVHSGLNPRYFGYLLTKN